METSTKTNAAAILSGDYTLTGGEKYGEPIPPSHLEGSTARIADNAIEVSDHEKNHIYAATYEILTGDPVGPWKIRMTSKVAPEAGDREQTVEGLIEKRGRVVRLIYALEGEPAPTGFKTGPGELMFEMKSVVG
jgi:hypothetical protein